MILKGKDETIKFGKEFASRLVPGSVVALIGPLGAGKTTLTQSIASALGITENLTSPTFTVVSEYKSGRIPLYHFDVYRVNDPEELFELGFDEYINGDGICIIEWADLIEYLLPPRTIILRLDYGSGENERTITENVNGNVLQ